ncbi:MAG TPA: 50S ribosomal protein L10 [Acidobacteriota bacterium]|jgi:large subunit ribosomal protein L10|nr:50S ribosomal protein L10 [Acidobacteriota bacterium]
MNKAEKQVVVDDLSKTFRTARSLVLVDFRGMKVVDATELRRQISKANCGYQVVKNTLALIAAKDTAFEALKAHFDGPTAIAYSEKDPIALAKVLADFAKSTPTLQFKAAVVEGRVLDGKAVAEIAKLPSRGELIGKLLFLLNAPAQRLATVLTAPIRNLAAVLSQIKK